MIAITRLIVTTATVAVTHSALSPVPHPVTLATVIQNAVAVNVVASAANKLASKK